LTPHRRKALARRRRWHRLKRRIQAQLEQLPIYSDTSLYLCNLLYFRALEQFRVPVPRRDRRFWEEASRAGLLTPST